MAMHTANRIMRFKFKKNKLSLRNQDLAQNQYWITKIRKAYSNIIIYLNFPKTKNWKKVKPSTGQAKIELKSIFHY